MKTIALTRGQVALVDDEDFEILSKHKWHARPNWDGYRALRNGPNKRSPGAKRGWSAVAVPMHRDVLGDRKGYVVDHINRNPLDNRRENLRWATVRQNCCNRRHRSSASGFRGVYQQKSGSFYAEIKLGETKSYLGTFPTAIAAARAWDAAAKQNYGEFAVLNGV